MDMNDHPGVRTEMGNVEDPFKKFAKQREERLQRAYQLGLLHGINASSMARVERDVMDFEDYGWRLDE